MPVPDDCRDCLNPSFWTGTPIGQETTLGDNPAYLTGEDTEYAILVVHDAAGWKWNNIRLLADYFAREIGASVWVPDL
jgi:hypothetical protein